MIIKKNVMVKNNCSTFKAAIALLHITNSSPSCEIRSTESYLFAVDAVNTICIVK